eukprot:3336660-Prymnesium_polylepis.1
MPTRRGTTWSRTYVGREPSQGARGKTPRPAGPWPLSSMLYRLPGRARKQVPKSEHPHIRTP